MTTVVGSLFQVGRCSIVWLLWLAKNGRCNNCCKCMTLSASLSIVCRGSNCWHSFLFRDHRDTSLLAMLGHMVVAGRCPDAQALALMCCSTKACHMRRSLSIAYHEATATKLHAHTGTASCISPWSVLLSKTR